VISLLDVSPPDSSMYFIYVFTEITIFNDWALLKGAVYAESICSKAKLLEAVFPESKKFIA
jgi:uncharacterized membrane protein YjfL (UPF0719 family)